MRLADLRGRVALVSFVYLLDRAGRVREIYALEFFDQRQAWLDVRALLRER